jgi:hypothetical protein
LPRDWTQRDSSRRNPGRFFATVAAAGLDFGHPHPLAIALLTLSASLRAQQRDRRDFLLGQAAHRDQDINQQFIADFGEALGQPGELQWKVEETRRL